MLYRLPEMKDEAPLREYMREHYENGEHSITASMGLADTDYGEWVGMICRNAEEGNAEWGRSILCLCLEKDRIVGLLSIRYELSPELTDKYGDIGYGVRPSERRRGYAAQMLRHALDVCREKGMERAILGCFKDNIASAAVIEKCGGVLLRENDNYEKGHTSRYYEIRL